MKVTDTVDQSPRLASHRMARFSPQLERMVLYFFGECQRKKSDPVKCC